MKSTHPTDVIVRGTIRVCLLLNRGPAQGRLTIERLASGPQEHWYPSARFSPRDAAVLMELLQAAIDRLHESETKTPSRPVRPTEAASAPSAMPPDEVPTQPTPSTATPEVSSARASTPQEPPAPKVTREAGAENGRRGASPRRSAALPRATPAKATARIAANRRPARSR